MYSKRIPSLFAIVICCFIIYTVLFGVQKLRIPENTHKVMMHNEADSNSSQNNNGSDTQRKIEGEDTTICIVEVISSSDENKRTDSYGTTSPDDYTDKVGEKGWNEDYKEPTQIEDIKNVDDDTFKIIKEAYSKIDFFGEFEKGHDELYGFYARQYLRLLNCEVTFFDKYTQESYYLFEFREMDYTWDHQVPIYGQGLSDTYDPNNYLYYYFDVDIDGEPELCITNGSRFVYIFKYNLDFDIFTLWFEIPPSHLALLGSRKLWLSSGTSPLHMAYYQLDQNGDYEISAEFSVEGYHNTLTNQDDVMYSLSLPVYISSTNDKELSDSIKDLMFTRYNERLSYFRVTKEQWEEITNDYFKARVLAEEGIAEIIYTYQELLRVSEMWIG
ncbi:MAG: hypothetical protein FWH52_07285 [Synergistaceae bacterium]|nr:hypothetical protein [Synergistaceae bacterium]